MYITFFYFVIFTFFSTVYSLPCADPISNTDLQIGTCTIIPNSLLVSTSLTNVVIDLNNTIVDCNGNSILPFDTNNITIKNVFFNNCKRYYNSSNIGGGTLLYTGNGTLTLFNVQITSSSLIALSNTTNFTNINGGAISAPNAYSIIITSCYFHLCSAMNGGAIYTSNFLIIKSTLFSNITATNNGGVIYTSNSISVDNSTILYSESNNDGGAIYSNPSPGSGQGISITNTKFDMIISHNNGGVIKTVYPMIISRSNFTKCNATRMGGVIHSTNVISIEYSNFDTIYTLIGKGAVIYSDEYVAISYSSFTNTNSLTSSGGVLFTYGMTTVHNSNFTNCTSRDSGGAIASLNSVSINNCNFYNSVSNSSGGAIWIASNEQDTVLINNTNFIGCEAYDGAAISATGINTHYIIDNCFFYGCHGNSYTRVSSVVKLDGYNNTNTMKIFNSDFVNNIGECIRNNFGSTNVSCTSFINNAAIYPQVSIILSIDIIHINDVSFINNAQPYIIETIISGSISLINYHCEGNCNTTGNVVVNNLLSAVPSCIPNENYASSGMNSNSNSNSNSTGTISNISTGNSNSNNDSSNSSNSNNSDNDSSNTIGISTTQSIGNTIVGHHITGDIYGPIISEEDIYFSGISIIHISSDGVMISSTGNIYGGGTLILDFSNFDYDSQTITLFDGYPLTPFEHIIVQGLTSCYDADYTSLYEVDITFMCGTDSSSKFRLF